MPYTSEHKERSREKILNSAYLLFATKGYEAISVNEVMADCALTRGAFYAHFDSKAELFKQALIFGFSQAAIVKPKPTELSDKVWLGELLDGYLSIEHVEGLRPCPLAFLSTDIATRDKEIKNVYNKAFEGLNKRILYYAEKFTNCSTSDILALTTMMIGAVAIARTIDNKKAAIKILNSCRQEISVKLDGA